MRPEDIFALSRTQAIEAARNLTRPTIIVSIDDPDAYDIVFDEKPDLWGVHYTRFFDVEISDVYGISYEDAAAILDFVESYVSEPVQVIVHCYAGQSRSAGVAAALQELLGKERSPIFDDWHYKPNMRCYETILSAARDERESDEDSCRRVEFWRNVAASCCEFFF